MKIVILAPSDRTFVKEFLPNYKEEELPMGYSGAPFIGSLVKHMLFIGHEISLITTSQAINNNYITQEYSFQNFTWIVVPARPKAFRMNGKKLGRIIDFFRIEQKLMLVSLNKISPDIIHAHWSYEFAGTAIRSNYPFLITIHDNPYVILKYFKNAYRLWRLIMAEKNLKQVKFASTVSPYMLEYVSKRCETVRVIPNPIEIKNEKKVIENFLKQKLLTISAPRIVMIINGWNKRKNGKKGLTAFSTLQQQLPEAQLILIGSGSEENGIAFAQAKELKIANITFMGVIPHDLLILELIKAHILLHPALEESFGVVLIEAMANGVLPVGGNKSGAVPWVINDNKLLVDVNDPEAMANKMYELCHNEELYTELSKKAFKNVVNRFSSKEVVKQYLEYYSEILSA